VAISLLLKDLAAKREIIEEVLTTEISYLRGLFQDILKSLEAEDGYNQDEHLTDLKRKIRVVLNSGYNGSPVHRLEQEGRGLNDLLEFTILTLAEKEKSYRSPLADRLREIRWRIRKFLKAQFDIRRKLSGKIEMGLLSKL
jgi:hypothetical protein